MGMPQLPPEFMQFLLSILSQPSGDPAGDVTQARPARAVPQMAKGPTELEGQLSQLLSLLQMAQPQAMARAAPHGAKGGMFGYMGGRPPGS